MSVKRGVAAIEKHGILLVYPIDNRPEPPSIWSSFHPKIPMRWEWDQDGDDRVADLWHLKTQLSGSGKVVYAKWYRDRATFFSREVFTWTLAALGTPRLRRETLDSSSRLVLESLELDSPLSTKQLKVATDLRGRFHEPAYQKAMKALWSRLLIVGYGEFEDGAFPSLAVGATKILFEDLWNEASAFSAAKARELLERKLPEGSLFLKQLDKPKVALAREQKRIPT